MKRLPSTVVFVLLAAGCAQTASDGGSALAREGATYTQAAKREYDLALSAMQSGDYAKAVVILEGIGVENGSHAGALTNLGIAYKHLDRLENAEDALRRAVTADPSNVVAYNELGLLYRREGQFAASRDAYETALKLRPDYGPSHLNLGILCELYLQDSECALRHYERYVLLAGSDDTPVPAWISALRQQELQ